MSKELMSKEPYSRWQSFRYISTFFSAVPVVNSRGWNFSRGT
jgi:hypothetical protein